MLLLLLDITDTIAVAMFISICIIANLFETIINSNCDNQLNNKVKLVTFISTLFTLLLPNNDTTQKIHG